MDSGRRYPILLRSRILILPSKTKLLDLSCDQPFEPFEGCWCIGKQIQPSGWVFHDLNCAIVDPIINPVGSDVKHLGNLGQGERALHLARVGLVANQELPMFQADSPDRTW